MGAEIISAGWRVLEQAWTRVPVLSELPQRDSGSEIVDDLIELRIVDGHGRTRSGIFVSGLIFCGSLIQAD
jgi:hypothetical protein